MPVYLETIDNESLRAIAIQCRSLTIVVCGGCANESLAYTNGMPLTITTLGATGIRKSLPYAAIQEVNRLTELFMDWGLDVNSEVFFQTYPCFLNDDECQQIRERLPFDHDILALSCPAAARALQSIVNESMQVFGGMTLNAFLFYRFEEDADLGITHIVDAQLAPIVK